MTITTSTPLSDWNDLVNGVDAPHVAPVVADPGSITRDETPACAGLGVTMFFSEHFDDIAAAKLLCLQCPIRERCLDEAVERGEQYGIWGGQLFEAGRIVVAKRRRGRPAKVPRPCDSLPQVEVPAAYRRLVVAG